MHLKNLFNLFLYFLISSICFAQPSNKIDYLGVQQPIHFNKKSYNLVWSTHPSASYYKQEYLIEGEKLDDFKTLITIDVLESNLELKTLVGSKIADLKKLKAINPIVNYQVFEKGAEIMLDFLLSQNSADGKTMLILERNVYRYNVQHQKGGKRMIVLFAVSERAYENDIDNFLVSLKKNKLNLPNSVAAMPFPVIKLSDKALKN